jgi:hypothetical protein
MFPLVRRIPDFLSSLRCMQPMFLPEKWVVAVVARDCQRNLIMPIWTKWGWGIGVMTGARPVICRPDRRRIRNTPSAGRGGRRKSISGCASWARLNLEGWWGRALVWSYRRSGLARGAGRQAGPANPFSASISSGTHFLPRKRLALVLFSRQNSASQLTQIIPEKYGPHLQQHRRNRGPYALG